MSKIEQLTIEDVGAEKPEDNTKLPGATNPEESYSQLLEKEEELEEEAGNVFNEIVRLEKKQEELKFKKALLHDKKVEAEDRLAEFWNENLVGSPIVFSGGSTHKLTESEEWKPECNNFDSAIGIMIEIKGRDSKLPITSNIQKKRMILSEPSVVMLVDNEEYLFPLGLFEKIEEMEEIDSKKKLIEYLKDPTQIKGTGLMADKDIQVDPELIFEMHEQWSQEVSKPTGKTIKAGTLIYIHDVIVDEKHQDRIVVELEAFEEGGYEGVRPQNATVRMDLGVIAESINKWQVIDDINFIVD